jgi:hypothetical protein
MPSGEVGGPIIDGAAGGFLIPGPPGPAASGPIVDSDLTQATARLLGRTTAGAGAIEEITAGQGLSLAGGDLFCQVATDAALGIVVVPGVSALSVSLGGTIDVKTGGVDEARIGSRAVTFAKLQTIEGLRLLGRSDVAAGSVSELQLGVGLEFGGFGGTVDVTMPVASATTAAACSGNAATATTAAACSGNAATATTLQTARTINGTSFNGSADITLPQVGASGPLSGVWLLPWGATGAQAYQTAAFAADRIYLQLFTIGKPATLNTIKWGKDGSLGTPMAGRSMKVLVYDVGADGWPDALLWTSSAQTLTDTGGVRTISSIGLAVTGNVWIGCVFDGAIAYTGGSVDSRMYVPSASLSAGFFSSASLSVPYRTVAFDSSYASPANPISGTKVHLGSTAQPCVYPEFVT